jgi:hypothetical protein
MDRTPLRIRLSETSPPLLVVGAVMHGANSWTVEVVDGSSRRSLEITDVDFETAEVIDLESGDARRLTVLDLAALPDAGPVNETESVWSDPEVGSSTPLSATSRTGSGSGGRGREKALTAILSVLVLLLVGAGGFAAGWVFSSAQNDDAESSTLESSVPLADLFETGPGPLDGREVQGRAGASWSDPSDSFVVAGGGVQASPDGDSPVIALLEQSGSITSVRASYSAVAPQAGLVFRYQDEANYWMVVAAPDFGTWAISHVKDGTLTKIGDSGFALGSTVEVIFVGSTIQVWIDGVLRETIHDGFLADSNLVGLVVAPGGQDAICDEFFANTV